MIIKFSEMLSKKAKKKEINMSFDLEPFNFEGDNIKSLEKVLVNGTVTATEELILLELNIKAKLEVSCSRCLDNFIYLIDIDIEERFTNNEEFSDEEIVFVEGDELDISLIVENSIISTLPIKRLCKETCKGLCSQCGVNLNVESCNCNNADVDIRFSKLKELFSNKEV